MTDRAPWENPSFRQYAVAIIANLSILTTGLGVTWPSPVLVKLSNITETVLSPPITQEERSRIVSVGFLISLFMTLPTLFLLERIGRKYTMILGCLPRFAIGYILLFASDVWMLQLARALVSISDGILYVVVPLYVSEIASNEIRGALSTILPISYSTGVVLMLNMGLSYMELNVIYLMFIVLSTIPLMCIPESPYFLYSKGRIEASLKVLSFLRSSDTIAKQELKEYSAANNNVKVKIKDILKNGIFYKSFAIAIFISISSQATGFNSMIMYLQTILETTQTSVRPKLACVVIGWIQLVASLCTIFVTDRFGRKPTLAITMIGMTIGMSGLGIFFKLKDEIPVTGFMNYLPLISLVIVVFSFCSGIGSVMWGLTAEIFDDPSRSTGVAISGVVLSACVFFVTEYFTVFTESIGATATYFVFAVNSAISCLFIVFCLPETKGKSFDQIQIALGAKPTVDIKKLIKS